DRTPPIHALNVTTWRTPYIQVSVILGQSQTGPTFRDDLSVSDFWLTFARFRLPVQPMKPLLAALALSLSCSVLAAQTSAPKLEFPAASPPTTLKQRVGVTDIEVNYSRPSMRGREIFGGLVEYGKV